MGEEADKEGIRSKLARWFWCGVLGELYGSAVESRFARDLPDVLDWINGGNEPATMQQAIFSPGRFQSLRTRNSAAYKGLQALLIRGDALDFRTGYSIDDQLYFDERIDIHHVFPQYWCTQKKIKPEVYNSILNKTPLSAKTNRTIGGNAPSVYLAKMESQAQIASEKMDEIIRSHAIKPELLRTDNFENFLQAREELLISLVEKAMGKPVVRGLPAEVTSGDGQDEEDVEE
jgi:hypothetical protein